MHGNGETLDELIWGFAPDRPRPAPQSLDDLEPTTSESEALAKDRERIEEYEKFCESLGEQPADVALAWLLHQPAVTAPIVGPRTGDQLDGSLVGCQRRCHGPHLHPQNAKVNSAARYARVNSAAMEEIVDALGQRLIDAVNGRQLRNCGAAYALG